VLSNGRVDRAELTGVGGKNSEGGGEGRKRGGDIRGKGKRKSGGGIRGRGKRKGGGRWWGNLFCQGVEVGGGNFSKERLVDMHSWLYIF